MEPSPPDYYKLVHRDSSCCITALDSVSPYNFFRSLTFTNSLVYRMEKQMVVASAEKSNLPCSPHPGFDCHLGSVPIIFNDKSSIHWDHSDCIKSQAQRPVRLTKFSVSGFDSDSDKSPSRESSRDWRERESISNGISRVAISIANATGLDPRDIPVPFEGEVPCTCPRAYCPVH